MPDFLRDVAVSLLASGGLLALLVFLTKDWLTERLKQSIQHEYARDLERYRHDLRHEHDLAIERLKVANAEMRAVKDTATASFAATHNLGHARRLDAIAGLWRAFLALKASRSPIFIVHDILTPEEIASKLVNPTTGPWIEELSLEKMHAALVPLSSQADADRPFVGEPIYSLFYAYRALLGRLLMQFIQFRDNKEPVLGFAEAGVRRLLSVLLPEEAVRDFDSLRWGRLARVDDLVTSRLLCMMSDVISGCASTSLGFEEARRVYELSRPLEESLNPEVAGVRSVGE